MFTGYSLNCSKANEVKRLRAEIAIEANKFTDRGRSSTGGDDAKMRSGPRSYFDKKGRKKIAGDKYQVHQAVMKAKDRIKLENDRKGRTLFD